MVDDSALVRQAATLALETFGGWEAAVVESGAEALEHVASSRPDAILLDVEMPGLDGPATLVHLRAEAATRDIPVILLTAHEHIEDDERLAGVRLDGLIIKPFAIDALADQVDAILLRPDPGHR